MRLLAPFFFGLFVLAVPLPLACAGESGPLFDPAELGLSRVSWVLPLADLSPGAHTKWGIVDGKDLFVFDSKNVFHCIDLESGVHRWILALDGTPTFRPGIGADTISFCVGDKLVLVKRSKGSRILDKTISFTPCAAPACTLEVAFASSLYKNKIVSIDPATGLAGWTFRFKAPVTAAPVLAGQGPTLFLYAVSNDGTVACLDPAKAGELGPRQAEWVFTTGDRNTAEIVVSNDLLLVASQDCSLYAFNRLSGAVKWRFFAGVPLYKSPQVMGDKVFQKAGEKLFCLDRAKGKVLWSIKGMKTVAGVVKDTAFLQEGTGNFTLVNASKGTFFRKVEPRRTAGAIPQPDPAKGILLFTDGEGIQAYK